MKHLLLYLWYKYLGAFFRLLPIKKNRIIFENFFGKGYGDNPKYISDELLSRDNEKFELIWLIKGKYYDEIPKKIKQVKRGTLKELYYISTSKVWVDNCRKHYGVQKRKEQYYIQTWHGSIGLKKVEKDCESILPKSYLKSAKNDSKMIDLIPSGSKFFSNLIKSSFWYNGEIFECGTPRCDIFFENRKKDNAYKTYKTILYAPTFRDDNNVSVYNLDYNNLVNILEKNTNEEWKIIVRFHPNVSYLQDTIKYSEKIIDGSKFDDMNELILNCDMLITDYSSSMFDALLISKPVFLYTPDIDNYFNKRGTYIQVNQLPFPVACTEQELISNINYFDQSKYEQNIKLFVDKIGLNEDGHASERIVDRIIEVIK